jgi:SAM-dependent methyltransferase
VGRVRFGHLRRLVPINENWGNERGGAVDRYYIERFLGEHRSVIRGRVLEIGTDIYTRLLGESNVSHVDVLHVDEQRPEVTIVADLTRADQIDADSYDCIILTQTLQFIFDVPAAVATVHRILRPGGVVLVTVSGISKIGRYEMNRWGQYWSFTTASMRRLFEGVFPSDHIQVDSHGNVLAAIAFLHGLSWKDLKVRELDHTDPDYQVLVTLRAVKPDGTS